VLIDFEGIHRSYLIGHSVDGAWQYRPTNPDSPQTGFFPSTHQVFSNHALQIALFIYNRVSSSDQMACTGVSHCLYLNFTHRKDGRFLLNKDPRRVAFNLDLGTAGELYGLAQGLSTSFSYSSIRAGKSPKRLMGKVISREGQKLITLRADWANSGVPISIEVELDRTACIALAAHCIGYGKLLYPSLSDGTIQALLSASLNAPRACPELIDYSPNADAQAAPVRACAEENAPALDPLPPRLKKAIWAIGNQKWPNMSVIALQKIQAEVTPERAQTLIDEANAGDFSEWDTFL
jgi:hypothetical protein